jgi:hypothetical protein
VQLIKSAAGSFPGGQVLQDDVVVSKNSLLRHIFEQEILSVFCSCAVGQELQEEVVVS